LKRKNEIINKLKFQINNLSMKITKKPFTVDTDKLGSAIERKKFETHVRTLGIDHLHISKHLCNLESDEILKRSLLSETRCVIRLYIISGYDISSRDNGSASDPYLFIQCNEKTYNERDNYQMDQSNPEFHKMYDFEGKFPGSTPLKIQVWDYDAIFGDDLVGTTNVDLEDRFFSLEWNSLVDKPIEYRQIYHPSSSMSQGVLKMWVEINPTSVQPGSIKEWDISPKPPEDFEVRVCVLNCKDIIAMDWEGTTDFYMRGFFDTKEEV